MGYIEPYQQLQTTIANCQKILSTSAIEAAAIKIAVQAIEVCFRDRVLPLDAPSSESLHSIQVEINKQLRLLKTDCLFLQSAQRPDTRHQRLQQITDRLKRLQSYCEMAIVNQDTIPH